MELNSIVSQAIYDTKVSLWPAFAPEIILSCTIFLLLLFGMTGLRRIIPAFAITLLGCLAGLYYLYPAGGNSEMARYEIFTGMLVYDGFSVYVRGLLLVFVALFSIFTAISGIPDKDDATDFYCLILGSTIGMCLMASANHLLIIFLGIEMASVPSYALAAMLKGRKESSEAALKYAVYGAGAAGVMLYGISLLAGLVGSAHLPTMALRLVTILPAATGAEKMVLVLAALMLFVGLAFKLAAFPFHFWCPDVFEGASAEVDAFLSVASKAAALALLVRVCVGLSMAPAGPAALPVGPLAYAAEESSDEVADLRDTSALYSVTDAVGKATPTSDPLSGPREFIALLVGTIAAVTCTFGNLAAYGQTNIKRLLAYSTIAHAGYMMLPIPVVLMLYGVDDQAAKTAVSALGLYMAMYLFMNLAAFAIVAFLRNDLFSEQISDYAGLIQRRPVAVVCMVVVLFSLVGIPPLAGFIGKFKIFASLADGYQITSQSWLLTLLVIGGINTVISLFYYLRVAKVMVIDPVSDRVDKTEWSPAWLSGAFALAVTLPLLVLFFRWDALNEWTMNATKLLF